MDSNHIMKKQRIDDEIKKLKEEKQIEESSLMEKFHNHFLDYLKEKAKKTKLIIEDVKNSLILVEEDTNSFADFILNVKSLKFCSSVEYRSAVDSRLQCHHNVTLFKLCLENNNVLSLVWSTNELQKRNNGDSCYAVLDFSDDINKSMKKIYFEQVNRLWNSISEYTVDFLITCKYIKDDPDFEKSKSRKHYVAWHKDEIRSLNKSYLLANLMSWAVWNNSMKIFDI